MDTTTALRCSCHRELGTTQSMILIDLFVFPDFRHFHLTVQKRDMKKKVEAKQSICCSTTDRTREK